ncbi:MAG TPA: multidrug efflux RND transporter permease subunit [Gemmatimonadaceae bacterium]
MTNDPEVKYFFVRRPIFAAVISIAIVLLGIFSLHSLPIDLYPRITPPVVQVTAVYPGATAQDVANAVAAPIEQQLSGIPGLLYYKSSNASDGSMNLQIYFDISRDQDLAAVDVQNQIKLAEPQLPQEVVRNGVTVKKAQTNILMALALSSSDPRYDAGYLSNYAQIYVQDELKRLPGVGDATTFGQLDLSMLLSLDPNRLAHLGLTVTDVANAVSEQNTTNPAGRIGREPSPPGTQLTIPVTTLGRLTDPKQYENIIVRAEPDGSIVRIGDVGHVTMGQRDYDLVGRLDGHPTALILVYLRPGASALDVDKAVVARMQQLQRTFPQGITWSVPFDTTPFITQSVKEVVQTLVEALLLVTAVVFIFLQSWRATLIPLVAVPVSLLGAFFGMQLLGFSVNLLTLFGLVLAIGIVVDDAIVVIENVDRIMAAEHVRPAVAADRAIRQVASALVAIVLVLCAVFIPVAFVGGITGQMYKQFAITIAVSVIISGIVALTLTPALCAVLLRHESAEHQHGIFGWFNHRFSRLTDRYVQGVEHALDHARPWIAAFVVILGLIFIMIRIVPTAFLQTEDKGYFAISVELPDDASLQRTNAVVQHVEQYLLARHDVRHVVALVGLSLIQGASQTSSATMFVNLKPWDERANAGDILNQANGQFFQNRDATIFGFNLPEIPGIGVTSGLELNLQDQGVNDLQRFAAIANEFASDANKLPQVQQARASIRVNVPQIYVDVDRAKAKSLGVSLSDLFQTLQSLLGTLYVNDFNLYGKTYRVQIEAQQPYRMQPNDIGSLFVRGGNNQMIPVSALTKVEFRSGPNIVTRFDGFTSALVTASPGNKRSSGEMLDAVENLARTKYAALGVGEGLSGQSYQERASAGGGLVLSLGIIMVFLVLAAQYESWSIPFAVLLGLPFGVLGAYLGMWLRGIPSDVYFQIGIITVVGLAAKNAILIVEFASEQRAQGKSVRDAAVEAGRERLRPILMTSLAFILGVVPLVVAGGAGAVSRHSIGTAVFAGMLFATSIGTLFIPLFFALIRRASEHVFGHHGASQPAPARPAEGD